MSLLLALALLGATDPELVVKNPTAPSIDVSNRVMLGARWRRAVVRQGFDREVLASFGRPGIAATAGLVIVGTGEGNLLALDERTGETVWEKKLGAPCDSSVSIFTTPTHGTPQEWGVVAANDGTLVAFLAQNGNELWRTDLGADSRAPATLQGNTILVATTGNKVLALDAATGKTRWSSGRGPLSALTIEGTAMAVSDGERVYACFSDGYVEAYRFDDGSRVWSRPLSLAGGEFVDADADPVLAGGRLFVASYSDGVYALNPSDGATLWSRSATGVVSLAMGPRGLLAASGDGYLWTFANQDGALVSRTHTPKGPMSRIVIEGELVMLTSGDNGLWVLDGVSGRPLQASAYPDRLHGDPSFSQKSGTLVAMSASGHVYAFRLGAASWVR